MASKVSQIAKEYQLSSSEIIEKLKGLGEHVTSAASTIAPPVERKLRAELGEPPEPKPETKKEPKVEVVEKTVEEKVVEETAPEPSPIPVAPKPVEPAPAEENDAEKIAVPTPADVPAFDVPKPIFRKTPFGINVGGSNVKRGSMVKVQPGQRPPRTGGPQQRQGNRPDSKGYNQGSNSGNGQNRGSYNRPNFQSGQPQNNQGGQGFGQRPNAGGPQKPGGFAGGKGFVGRGQTAGAHGKGAKKAKYKADKRKQQQIIEEEFTRKTVAGVVVPHGDGETVIRLKQGANLTDFAEKIAANPANLVMTLMKLGQMVTQNQSLDEETFELLGLELGYKIQMVTEEEEDRELLTEFDIDLDAEEGDEENMIERAPVVTVMGHVDHGKTRLLDAVRKTNVIETEAGGITQRIGAYQIHIPHEGKERKITFIDTPGHEAFTAMRARGAEITDVAILVVAANDGVMPQTIEAINHAQSANVPIVVAVNKIDVEGADPAKVRGQLTEFGLVPEEYGGDTIFVDISAKQNIGIDKLLDSVLLTVDAAMELKANPNMSARGSVIESRLDKGRGAVTAVLVQSGTLRVGDPVVAGRSYGKVRAMYDENGKPVVEAEPSRPVRILGMQTVPTAGDVFIVTDDERTARQISEKREAAHRNAQLAKRRKRLTLEDFKQAVEDGKVDIMNLIIKGDTSGSVEALEDALMKLEEAAELNGEVGLNVIHRGVGDITQNDVNLATVDNAIIIAFNVKPAGLAGDLADAEGVEIRSYKVIYQAIEDIELSLHGMLKPEYEENVTGYAEVREIFKSSKFGTIAGSIVKGGVITRNSLARVFRGEDELAKDLRIDSLKRFKDDATTVKDGFECGIGLGAFNDIEVGDIIETYEMVEKKREVKKSK